MSMTIGRKLVKQDKLRYWMDPNEYLSGTTVPKLVTAWDDATFTNATYSSDNQGIYVMSSGGKISFPQTAGSSDQAAGNASNPLKNIWINNSGTLNRTMSAWVYCTSGNSVAIYYSDASAMSNYDNNWRWSVRSNGNLRFTLNKVNNSSGYYESASSMVDYDAWTYLTMTTEDNGLSGNNRMFILKFYKNGVYVENPSKTYTQGSSHNFHPGNSPYTANINRGFLFEGDDHKAGPFYMHDVTLTAAEIKRNYMQHKSRFQ